MSDLHLIEQQIDAVLAKRNHYADMLRGSLRYKIKFFQNYGEHAIEYARDLIRSNNDVTGELNELEAYGHSLLLQVALLRKQSGKTE